MSIDKITIVITDEDFGDVSFRDEYSAVEAWMAIFEENSESDYDFRG